MTIITDTALIEAITFEHYNNPIGIDISCPRITWSFQSGPVDWRQLSYELRISKDDSRSPEVYLVESEESVLVSWPSSPLLSRQKAQVAVRAKGVNGIWTQTATAVVEAGLLESNDWSSHFVTCTSPQDPTSPHRPFRLRQKFTLPDGRESLPDSRLYITSLGVYEASINGQRVGEDVLAPGWTSYGARLPYQTHDITHLLKPGENEILAWVGEGWYAGRLGYQGGQRNIFGDRPALLAQLEVAGQAIDGKWEWAFGALIAAELYDGEVYNFALDDRGEEGAWAATQLVPFPDVKLFSSQSPPIRAVETVAPIKIFTSQSGKTIIDFGQNLGGVIRLLSDPPADSPGELTIRHAEVMEHGELGVRPLRYAKATDRIILDKNNSRSIKGYMPKFTFHGFRYVEITGWRDLKLADLEAVVLQSSMRRTGTFTSSHPLINRLHENAVWSTKGNTIGIPSDCPQRDERLGWTGDVCVYAPTMSYLFDTSGFLAEWLQDLWCDQKKLDGIIPIFVPDTGTDTSTPEAIWGDAAVSVPSDLHHAHGDRIILERQFDSAVMWLDKGVKRDLSTGLWSRERDQLGDWLAPRAPPETPNMGPTDNILVADAWLIHSTRTAAYIAKTIGRNDVATKYTGQAVELTDAFYNEYVTASGRLVSETQTALCLLLQFDIFPSSPKQGVDFKSLFAARLGQLVSKANWLIDTGFAGTPIILKTLAENGHLSHAYRMLQATECPSWLSTVLLGATTIWERWDSMLADGSINTGEMTSFNHYALGSVATFMHEVIGGLRPLSPGWKTVSIGPQPGGTITAANTSHISPYGKIAVNWTVSGDEFRMTVDIPPNCSAQIRIPGSKNVEMIGSGVRHYTTPYTLPPFPPPAYIPHFAPVRPNEWAS